MLEILPIMLNAFQCLLWQKLCLYNQCKPRIQPQKKQTDELMTITCTHTFMHCILAMFYNLQHIIFCIVPPKTDKIKQEAQHKQNPNEILNKSNW